MMSEDVFKAPKAKRSHHRSHSMNWSPSPKKRRTKDDFFSFCNIVLAYTQYESLRQEDLRIKNNTSPLDSTGSAADSFSSESTSSTISAGEDSMNKSEFEAAGFDSAEFESGEFESGEFESGEFESGFSGDEELREGDKDSWELITCYCMKPFAGRPMIECSECDTWIHLSCAKIRKSNIPEEFVCQRCRDSKLTTRKSTRIRSEKKHMNV